MLFHSNNAGSNPARGVCYDAIAVLKRNVRVVDGISFEN